jgi:hypothetical protein
MTTKNSINIKQGGWKEYKADGYSNRFREKAVVTLNGVKIEGGVTVEYHSDVFGDTNAVIYLKDVEVTVQNDAE